MTIMPFIRLFESALVSKLIEIVSKFQALHPYPDYGILYWSEDLKKAVYVVGDGQEGSLDELENELKRVDGVKEVEISDEGGRPPGFVKVWQQ